MKPRLLMKKKIINPSCLCDEVINFSETELNFDTNQQVCSVLFACANGVDYYCDLNICDRRRRWFTSFCLH